MVSKGRFTPDIARISLNWNSFVRRWLLCRSDVKLQLTSCGGDYGCYQRRSTSYTIQGFTSNMHCKCLWFDINMKELSVFFLLKIRSIQRVHTLFLQKFKFTAISLKAFLHKIVSFQWPIHSSRIRATHGVYKWCLEMWKISQPESFYQQVTMNTKRETFDSELHCK